MTIEEYIKEHNLMIAKESMRRMLFEDGHKWAEGNAEKFGQFWVCKVCRETIWLPAGGIYYPIDIKPSCSRRVMMQALE